MSSFLQSNQDDTSSYQSGGNNSIILETSTNSSDGSGTNNNNNTQDNPLLSPTTANHLPTLPKTNISGPTVLPINANTTTSNTVSHQHHKEQEMLSGFAIPQPPVSTQQSSVAAEREREASGLSNPLSSGEIDHPRTLWMGDLDPWLDEQAIVDLWWKILQKHVDVKIIKPKSIKPDSANYQGLSHSGYCFIQFSSYEDAQQALGLNGQLLPDIAMPSQQHFPNNPDNQKKYFRLNWASGATLNAPIVQTPEYSLFVGDLSASTTEAHLLAFFQKNFPNSIKTVRVMTDPVSGKSRCFGFVRFTDESERQRALIEMNGVWFGGRPLRVALATARTSTRKFQGGVGNNQLDNDILGVGGGNGGGSVVGGGQFYGNGIPADSQQNLMFLGGPPPPPNQNHNLAPGPPGGPPPGGYYGTPQLPPPGSVGSPFDLPQDAINYDNYGQIKSPMPMAIPPGAVIQNQSFSDPNNTTVFVGGLSSEVNEPTLFTLFKQFGLIQQVKIPPGKNCGFIKYSSREEAEEAIASMQGFIIGGNRVRLSWGKVSMNNKKFQHQQQHQQQHHQQQQHHHQQQVALSMGLGYGQMPPPHPNAPPGQLGVMPGHHGPLPPPLGIHAGPLPPPGTYGSQDYDNSHNSDNSGSFDDSNHSPQYYLPIGGAGHAGNHEQLLQSMGNLSLDSSGGMGSVGGSGVNSGNALLDDPNGLAAGGYLIPPPNMYGAFGIPDLTYQQFIPASAAAAAAVAANAGIPSYSNGSPSPTSTPYHNNSNNQINHSHNDSSGSNPEGGVAADEEEEEQSEEKGEVVEKEEKEEVEKDEKEE
ncbi:negative growth regulatory protein [Scheffersomyces coipomensis]|uniref:negative growth regulatory protein n=1 Tax=Scheffersomyces coipomensis TaxID=1788519 RepID=UPI00315CA2E8